MTVKMWIGYGHLVDVLLRLFQEGKVADAVFTAIDIIDGSKQNIVTRKGEEDWWHLCEAMSDGKDIDFALPATDKQLPNAWVGMILPKNR